MRSAGSRSSRYQAVHSPVRPPPTIATSASVSPSRAARGSRASAPSESCQNDRPVSSRSEPRPRLGQHASAGCPRSRRTRARPMVSGGASCTTGSPRSSARQYSPASNSAFDRKPRSSRSDSSSLKVVSVALSLTSSMPKKYPSPRTSPTIGRSYSCSSVGAEDRRVLAHALVELLLLEDVEVLERDRRRHRMPAEGVAVVERRRAVTERLVDLVAHDGRADRRVARGHRLGAGDHVGHVAVGVAGEHVADAAEGADHLVRDQQHVVLVADLAHPLEVAGRRREAAARVLHRLEEDGRDGLGALEQDHLLDPVRGPQRRTASSVPSNPISWAR